MTVVEWGEGIAEGLAESRLEIRIIRALAHADEHADLDPRRVLMTPIGPRWYEMEVPDSHRPPLAEKVEREPLARLPPLRRGRPRRRSTPRSRCRRALVVAEHDGRVLLVHNAGARSGSCRWRDRWTASRRARLRSASSARRPAPSRAGAGSSGSRTDPARPRAADRVPSPSTAASLARGHALRGQRRASTASPGGTSSGSSPTSRRSTRTWPGLAPRGLSGRSVASAPCCSPSTPPRRRSPSRCTTATTSSPSWRPSSR